MKRVLLITGHYLESRRKAGFHWLADALARRGDEAVFVTAALSWLSAACFNYRMKYPVLREANRLKWVRPGLGSYVWWTPWHPADMRCGWLNRLTAEWFATYGELPLGDLEGLVRQADVIIFESTPGLLLVDRFRSLRPRARYVYRVSDDLRRLVVHPVVRQAEERAAPLFARISVPNEALFERFGRLPRTTLDRHCIRKDLFDAPSANPYRPEGVLRGEFEVNAIFVGTSGLDRSFLALAAGQLPTWGFHVIGPLAALPKAANIVAYGEMPFDRTVPYLQHADVGLHCLEESTLGEAHGPDSLKVVQYTYCRLPIVAPQFLRSHRPHVFYYRPGDAESIRGALQAARALDRRTVDVSGIGSWDDLAASLVGDVL